MIKKGELYYPDTNRKFKVSSTYKEAEKNPIKFWEKEAKEILWQKHWTKAFSHNPPDFKWFAGGKLNITESCFEKNFPGRKNKVALIWEPEPETERPVVLTYGELYRQVNKFANALKKMGVQKGDRVGIYLPMVPEVIVSMLACARIGAVHAIVFSAFSPNALSLRLQDTEAKILITADGYYRRGKVISLKQNADAGLTDTKVEKVIVAKRAGNEIPWQEGKDFWWHDLIKNESDLCKPVSMDSEDLIFILYTSGSTGKPKGTTHACGGYSVQAKYTGKRVFDLTREDDVFWSTADIGWITGHTYSCYAPLLNGATFLIFEGAPDWPDPARWTRIIEKHGVTIFYTAPTAIRMFEKYGESILIKDNFKTLRLLGSVGEPIDEFAWRWYFDNVGQRRCPIVDTWWQTETGGILITSLPEIGPFKPMYTGLPLPGTRFEIYDENGKPVKAEQPGNLVLLPPFVPGLLRGIYKNKEKYIETYWSKYGNKIYFTSDGALRDRNGLIRIVGRVDDVIKVAGHRVSTGELENAINMNVGISESGVVGVPDDIKGEVPIAFVNYKGEKTPDEVKKEVIGQIRKIIGPIAMPKEIYLVKDLPKTRSGKIMRRVLKKLFTGEELGDLSTLANPESVEEARQAIGAVKTNPEGK